MIKTVMTVFFVWSAIDRVRRTFSRPALHVVTATVSERFNSFLMIVLYVAVAVDGFVGFLARTQEPVPSMVLAGAVLYLIARYMRNAAIDALGVQWNIYTTAQPVTRLIALGPFKYGRHPYNSATVLELFGYGLLFSCIRTVLLTLLVFLPLTVFRLLIEERSLAEKFSHYRDYQRSVPMFFSLTRFLKSLRSAQDIGQLADIVRRFGVRQLEKIRFMSNSVAQYSRGYAVSRISGALIEIGAIDALVKDGHLDLPQFAKGRAFDLETLKVVFDYFSILGIFRKNHLDYEFTPYGKKLFDLSRGAFTLLYAYMPVFESLPEIIRGKRTYGVDVQRKSEFVGRGSAELAELLPFPYAMDILRRHHLNRILDLGCGSGEFLLRFCHENGFRGYGIDLSPEIVSFAEKQALERGLSDRVKFLSGDIRDLGQFKSLLKNVDVLTFMFVLHEFLAEDPAEPTRLLNEIRRVAPDRFILVTEVYRCSVGELIAHPVPVAEHHLFHKLSKQGLATVDEWHTIFRRAGYQVVEERRFDRAAQAYFLLKAAG